MNKKLSFLMLALAVAAIIIFAINGSTFYLALAGVNLCAALAGFFNNRIFVILGGAGMIYLLILMIRALLA